MVDVHVRLVVWSLMMILMMTQMTKHTVLSKSWCSYPKTDGTNKFEQKSQRFYEFDQESSTWKEVELPFDLYNCLNGNCTKVGSIGQLRGETNQEEEDNRTEKGKAAAVGGGSDVEFAVALPIRKRISITKMTDSSVWVTGQSGSIYERFWNGMMWVFAPHSLPAYAGHAVSVFIVNQTILSLNEDGVLFQLQLNENAQPIWQEFTPTFEPSSVNQDLEPNMQMQIKEGIKSHNGERLYFSTLGGSLIELREIQTSRWIYHGQPPGGSIAAIADIATMKLDVVFTVSHDGELYEFDENSKPSWKKHIWIEPTVEEIVLLPSRGYAVHGLVGSQSLSLFLLSKEGVLIERRMHQRKWKWVVHGSPEGYQLSSITPTIQSESNTKFYSLFLTTTNGSLYEYQIPQNTGSSEGPRRSGWTNHMHPQHAKVARGIVGLQLQTGRMFFPLDDGRTGELHLLGIGGDTIGPTNQLNTRRKSSAKYEWSIIDAPETEGWNGEYCTDERGPSNCFMGIKDRAIEEELNDAGTMTMRRRSKEQALGTYVLPKKYNTPQAQSFDNNFDVKNIKANFRMRAMQADRSFFLVTDNGIIFEYLYTQNLWLWLKHEHSIPMKGILGIYNGSLFLVDTYGSLVIRERSLNGLTWVNCTAMNKGRRVAVGPPWDGMIGIAQTVTDEDSLFFINKNGRLLRLIVAMQRYEWRDCRNPHNIKVTAIVDQEGLRSNIVFVVGSNGKLYQFNKITELWHVHYQSPHLNLSRLPGTTTRSSPTSLMGSLFFRSEVGALVEYHWNPLNGWNWIEHGTPDKDVSIVAAPGPSFDGNQLFVIGSDDQVYLRYIDKNTWKWKSYGFPTIENVQSIAQRGKDVDTELDESETMENHFHGGSETRHFSDKGMSFQDGPCNEKVASVRPIAFSSHSLVFELRDGRLAELRRKMGEEEEAKESRNEWGWSRIIATPTSQCRGSYWTANAS